MTKFFKTTLSISIWCMAMNVMAQTGTIKGKVLDENNKPFEFSGPVKLKNNPSIGDAIDDNGNFEIKNIPVGKHVIIVEPTDAEVIYQSITIKDGETLTLTFIAKEVEKKEVGVVTVSADKFKKDIKETITAISVLKPEGLIDNKVATSVSSAISQTPGVTIIDNEPQVRGGSGYSFGAGSRVLVMVDDLPMLTGDAGRPQWGFLPTENISQIEVSKGASSVLYGSAAINGVINLRTAYPTSKPLTKVTMFNGAFDLPKANRFQGDQPLFQSGATFLHSQKFGQLDFVLGANLFYSTGFKGGTPEESLLKKGSTPQTVIIDGKTYTIPAGTDSVKIKRYGSNIGEFDRRARVNMNLRYRSIAGVLGLNAGINTNIMVGNASGVFIWGGSNADSLFRAYDGTVTQTKSLQYTIDPFIEYANENGIKHSLRTRLYHTDFGNTGNQSNQSDLMYGEYQFQKSFLGDSSLLKGLVITSGLTAINTKGRSQLYKGNEDSSGVNTAQNFAAYLQVEKRFWDRLTVLVGGRFEYFEINGNKAQKPVFRAGFNWQLGHKDAVSNLGQSLRETYISGSIGQGFRFPTIAERYIRTGVGAVQIYPNQKLNPESSTGIEFSLKQGFKLGSGDSNSIKGYLDVSYFRQDYFNSVEFTFGQWGATDGSEPLYGLGFRSLNTGRTRTEGIDASIMASGQIGKLSITTLLGYTYMNPVALEPNKVYFVSQSGDSLSFTKTSSNVKFDTVFDANGSVIDIKNPVANSNILKYRFHHLVNTDIEFNYDHKYMLGLSVRYISSMVNIDYNLQNIDNLLKLTGAAPTQIGKYRDNHPGGNIIVDMRFGYNFTEQSKVVLAISNIANRIYSIRPGNVEAPRLFMLQYALKF